MKAMMILFLLNNNGNMLEKIAIPYSTVAACKKAEPTEMVVMKLYKVCVSMDHWLGKKQDSGVPLELEFDNE